MGNLDDILSKKMKQLGIERQAESAGVVYAAQKEIAKYISEEGFEVVSFKDGTLKISVRSAVTSGEIMNYKKLITDSLKIKKIKIILN